MSRLGKSTENEIRFAKDKERVRWGVTSNWYKVSLGERG